MQETFQELQATLEELHVAEEELRQQNEELDAAQQLIEAERQRYQELFDFAPEGYLVTDLHGLIREANAAAATLLGVSMRTLKGKPFANYIGEETRGEFRRRLRGLAGPATGLVRLPLTLAPRQGRPIAVEASVTRAFSADRDSPALLWVVRDMTERMEAERIRLALVQEQAARWKAEQLQQQFREQSTLLEMLLTTAPTGFAFVREDGHFLRANDALAQMLGVSPDEFRGGSIAALLGESNWQTLLPLFHRAVRGEAGPDAEIAHRQADGALHHLLISHYAVQTEEATLGVGMVVSDITERKAAEATLQTAYDREHKIAEVLQRSMLRSVPEDAFAGLSVATFYEAALAEAQIGGDFFDAFTIDSGKVALLVGDVSGKGLAAAASTAEIKYALRAFVREDLDPKATLERLNNFMCDARNQGDWTDSVFAVLSLFVIDPSTGKAHLALAEAEPALLRRVSGEIESLEPHGMLLGIEPKQNYTQMEVTLLPGDTLLMVTDGITEARRGRGFLGMDGLGDLLRRAEPQGAAQAIGEAILQGVQCFVAEPEGKGCLSDDACVLVVQRLAA